MPMRTQDYYPQRIVCLTEETTETLYLLGEEDRIVGISGFTVRPQRARKEKPKVSTFLDANIDQIVALQPDLVIGFSDLQAEIAQQLIKRGITVWVNNYRSIDGIFGMMLQLGALVGKGREAENLVAGIRQRIADIQAEVARWPTRPKVYFEEWYDPLIAGSQWVSEIIGLAGGEDVFRDKALHALAKGRIIEHPEEVITKNPDIILASWCGKKFNRDKLVARPGWDQIKAVQSDAVYEIDSSVILQPGPAAVTDGLEVVFGRLKAWREG